MKYSMCLMEATACDSIKLLKLNNVLWSTCVHTDFTTQSRSFNLAANLNMKMYIRNIGIDIYRSIDVLVGYCYFVNLI